VNIWSTLTNRRDAQPASALTWTDFIPPVRTSPLDSDALVVCSWLPLEVGLAWIDFKEVDNNNTYTVRVLSHFEDGSTRLVRRLDIEFRKPEPGWPFCVMVNGTATRFDGMLDFSFGLYPFEREVVVVQTGGRSSVLQVATLTGVMQEASVSA